MVLVARASGHRFGVLVREEGKLISEEVIEAVVYLLCSRNAASFNLARGVAKIDGSFWATLNTLS